MRKKKVEIGGTFCRKFVGPQKEWPKHVGKIWGNLRENFQAVLHGGGGVPFTGVQDLR